MSQSQTLVVTGVASGIGRETARLAVAAGHDVIGVDLHEPNEACGRFIAADLGDPASIAALVGALPSEIDALMNVAGVSGMLGAARTLAINFYGPRALSEAIAPKLKTGGAIVNVASIAGSIGVAYEAVYSATKGGLIAFSESVRYELAGTGGGVTVVFPAAVETSFFARAGRPYTRRFPRLVDPARVAETLIVAVERSTPEVFVPRWTVVPVRLRGGLPGAFRRAAGHSMRG